MNINELLKIATEKRASDLHIKVGNHPVMRVDGVLIPMVEQKRFAQEDLTSVAFGIMSDSQKERFKEKNEIDFAYSVSGLGRFRVNAFQQRGTLGVVFRTVPNKIKTFEELYLPEVLKRISLEPRGLILVTGTTGSGKTTTLATMIDYINTNRTNHIITIEDPIEFLHNDKESIISQREIGADTEDFSGALRSALRQDPDVILVGEMRDFETIQTALVAAETGHLVLSTLHTIDAAETVNRIIAVFPPYQQKQIRLQLASVLKGIISMRLIPKADGIGRVPAIEVLVATATVKECIIDPDKTRLIFDVISAGHSQYGMQTFDQSLMGLYKDGLITYEEALRNSSNPDDFALKIKGILSTSDITWEEKNKEVKKEDIKIDRFGL